MISWLLNPWFLASVALIITVYVARFNYKVETSTKKHIFQNMKDLSFSKVGLVLGTSKYNRSGTINYFYQYRIDATVKLYNKKKVKYILVSGDNGTNQYNEPKQIKKDLVTAGIPADKIFLDYAGFRTLDSVVRLKEVFEVNEVIIVSQKFHLQRALYLCNKHEIKAQGYEAKMPSGKQTEMVLIREKLARIKLLLDVVTNKQPKFLGQKEKMFKD